MDETSIDLSQINFDEQGRVLISSLELSTKLNELFQISENVSSSCNNGCGNTANSGCGNNGSCAESSAIFNRNDVEFIGDQVILNKYEFNKNILKSKLLGDSELNLKISTFNQ